MPTPHSWFIRNRRPLAGTGLAAAAVLVALHHAPTRDGVAAEDITPEQMSAALAEHAEWTTGDLLLDFVEPADGEGGSEKAIAELVSRLDAMPGLDVLPAGFYSEGEHLYRARGSSRTLQTLVAELDGEALLEGLEPEVTYALPSTAFTSEATGLDEAAPPEIAKPPRFDPDDPMFHYQWHMEQIDAPQAWASGKRGKGAVVAVIDTGVAWKTASGVNGLPDLAGTEFTKGESFVAGVPDGLDDHAHGSHVAGTIAQTTNNGVGVTGVAFGATIMPLKVLSKEGRGSVPGIANAIRYAADNGANVINMSLGGPMPSRVLAKAIEYAHEKGVVTVCAAGNESRSRVGYPAANQFSVAVSATNFDRELTFYSNWGAQIDVAAPGGDTRADKNGDGKPDGVLQNTIAIQDPSRSEYLWFQGTSMASPHAAGVAALIVGEGVTNPDEVERIMKDTADHPAGAAWDKYFGAGIVNAHAATVAAKQHYVPERAGLLGLLGLLGVSGLGVAASSRRRRWAAGLGLAGTAGLVSGAFGLSPLPYAAAGAVGGLAWLSSPLWLSAALPLLFTVLLMGYKALRPVLAGLSLGYAALLLHGALVLPTLLAGLPGGPGVDRLWLAANAALALFLAARVSRLK